MSRVKVWLVLYLGAIHTPAANVHASVFTKLLQKGLPSCYHDDINLSAANTFKGLRSHPVLYVMYVANNMIE